MEFYVPQQLWLNRVFSGLRVSGVFVSLVTRRVEFFPVAVYYHQQKSYVGLFTTVLENMVLWKKVFLTDLMANVEWPVGHMYSGKKINTAEFSYFSLKVRNKKSYTSDCWASVKLKSRGNSVSKYIFFKYFLKLNTVWSITRQAVQLVVILVSLWLKIYVFSGG